MAHKMAHHAGFVRRGAATSENRWRMQAAFLRFVGEVAPEVVDDLAEIAPLEAAYAASADTDAMAWRTILDDAEFGSPEVRQHASALADAIAKWARVYRLDAHWVIEAAVSSLVLARLSDLPVRLRAAVGIWDAPSSPPPWEFTVRGYSGNETVKEYRERRLEEFKQALNAYIEAAIARLDKDERVERATGITAATLDNLRRAALWQARGEAVVEGKQIRDTLARIALHPRPGLV